MYKTYFKNYHISGFVLVVFLFLYAEICCFLTLANQPGQVTSFFNIASVYSLSPVSFITLSIFSCLSCVSTITLSFACRMQPQQNFLSVFGNTQYSPIFSLSLQEHPHLSISVSYTHLDVYKRQK